MSVGGQSLPVPELKRAPTEVSALSKSYTNAGLHLRRALLSGVVPHAASLVATSLVGCFRHVSCPAKEGPVMASARVKASIKVMLFIVVFP